MIVPAIIDTNVVIAGTLVRNPKSPPAWIVGGMEAGRFPFVLSLELLAEYHDVLQRPRVRERHQLAPEETERILVELTANAIVVDPAKAPADMTAPDPGDQHLWDLFHAVPAAVLVTGDGELIDSDSVAGRVLTPAAFVDSM